MAEKDDPSRHISSTAPPGPVYRRLLFLPFSPDLLRIGASSRAAFLDLSCGDPGDDRASSVGSSVRVRPGGGL